MNARREPRPGSIDTKRDRPTSDADSASESSSVVRMSTIGFKAMTAKVAKKNRREPKIRSATRAA